MAYDSAKHDVFSERCKNHAGAMLALWEEGQRLNEIYVNEAESGAHAAFVTNTIATKQEYIDLIVAIQAYDAFINNAAVATADRMTNITPFTQGQ
jgi:hypothetical protein